MPKSRDEVTDGTEPRYAAGIAYERTGSGPTLLLVHGLGGTRRIWRPQLELLAAERDMIAVDMPGFGDSPPLEEKPTPWALAEALERMCAELGVERPHVAGNSLGGWAAIEMAKDDAAASLCLISPAGLWRRPLGPRLVNSRRWAKRLRPLLRGLTRSTAIRGAMLRTTLGRPENLTLEESRELIDGWVIAPGYDDANKEMRRHAATGLERVRVPTTIAWGDRDRLLRPPAPDRTPPRSRFVTMTGAGHTPNWDVPELLAEMLLEASGGSVRSEAA